jgi:hypothetical protein
MKDTGAKNFFAKRMLAALDEHKEEANAGFNSAKQLSDFVGLIMRTSFAMFVTLYFVSEGISTHDLRAPIFLYCALFSALLTVKMAGNLSVLTYMYLARDVFRAPNPWLAHFINFNAGVATAALVFGMSHLVVQLAVASTLLGRG